MTKRTIAALVVMMVTIMTLTPCFAKLDETRDEIMHRFGVSQLTDKSETYLEFTGKNQALILLRNGVSVIENYCVKGKYSAADAAEIVQTVIGQRLMWKKTPSKMWVSTDGQYAVVINPIPAPAGYDWVIQVGYTVAVVALNEKAGVDLGVHSTPTPAPKKDCAIVAAEAYARLKPVTYWCQVIGMQARRGNGEQFGHAMVAFKYQADGDVQLYDENGTLEIYTTNEDSDSIIQAFNNRLQEIHVNSTVLSMQFITH